MKNSTHTCALLSADARASLRDATRTLTLRYRKGMEFLGMGHGEEVANAHLPCAVGGATSTTHLGDEVSRRFQ
jgi:hypothetical protein